MIVERVPTSPRSPAGRAIRLAGLAVPALLLAGVVTAGLLGPRPEARSAAERDASAPPSVALAAPGSIAPAPDDAPSPVTFPRSARDLPVRSVAATRDAQGRNPQAHVIAVAGYLTIEDLHPSCVDRWLGSFGRSCAGRTVLADAPTRPFPSSTGGGAGFGALGAHLHPTFPPGVRVPRELKAGAGRDGSPVPVVVLGRFDPLAAGSCMPGNRGCDEAFIVERVAWVDGEIYRASTMIDPGLRADWTDPVWRHGLDVARAALAPPRTLLRTVFLTATTLGEVDQAAADAVRRAITGAPGGVDPTPAALWYVRGLVRDGHAARDSSGSTGPRIVWVVVEDGTGRVLARGTGPNGGSGNS